MAENVFDTLYALDVNEHKEGKNGLSYLSWTWAWAEFKKRFPTAKYSVWKDPATGLPYVFDGKTGYMVYTSVTVDDVTHEMWLPVMDGANKAMKDVPYTYPVKNYKSGKYDEKECKAATMFDINKTIMRCLTKNLAMFGLGLYIYAGEDLPESDSDTDTKSNADTTPTPAEKSKPKESEADEKQKALEEEAALRAKVIGYVNRKKMDKTKIEAICKAYKIKSLNELTAEQCRHYITVVEKNGGKIDE